MKDDHFENEHDIRVAQKTIGRIAEEPNQSDDPNRGEKQIRDQELLNEIETRTRIDVLAVLTALEQLPHRKSVVCLPKERRQRDQERDARTGSDPDFRENAAFRREQ